MQSAQYNWFGDLTLGAYYNTKYNGKDVKSKSGDDGVGSLSQSSWTQEFSSSSDYRSYRGDGNTGYGAAGSNYYASYGANVFVGFRPVLEPLNN